MGHDQWKVRSSRPAVRCRNNSRGVRSRHPRPGRRHGLAAIVHPQRVRSPLADPHVPHPLGGHGQDRSSLPTGVPLHPRQREPGRPQRFDLPSGRIPPVPPAGRHLGARRQPRHGALGTSGHRPRTRHPRPGDVRQLRRRRRQHLLPGSGRRNCRDLHLHRRRGGTVLGVQHRSRSLLETLRRQPRHPQRGPQGLPRPEGFLARTNQVVGDGGLPRRPHRHIPFRRPAVLDARQRLRGGKRFPRRGVGMPRPVPPRRRLHQPNPLGADDVNRRQQRNPRFDRPVLHRRFRRPPRPSKRSRGAASGWGGWATGPTPTRCPPRVGRTR